MTDEESWASNKAMLEKAILYIDDSGKLWEEIMSLLPGEYHTPCKGAKLEGLDAILAFRKNIINRTGGFDALQKQQFGATEEWEFCRKADGLKLGYDWDGLDYNWIDSKHLRMQWILDGEKHPCYLANQTILITKSETPKIWAQIEPYGKNNRYNVYYYVNSVDHFFTNLIWLVVSGIGGGDAYWKASTPGLLFSFADCEIQTLNTKCTPEKIAKRYSDGEAGKTLCAEMRS